MYGGNSSDIVNVFSNNNNTSITNEDSNRNIHSIEYHFSYNLNPLFQNNKFGVNITNIKKFNGFELDKTDNICKQKRKAKIKRVKSKNKQKIIFDINYSQTFIEKNKKESKINDINKDKADTDILDIPEINDKQINKPNESIKENVNTLTKFKLDKIFRKIQLKE